MQPARNFSISLDFTIWVALVSRKTFYLTGKYGLAVSSPPTNCRSSCNSLKKKYNLYSREEIYFLLGIPPECGSLDYIGTFRRCFLVFLLSVSSKTISRFLSFQDLNLECCKNNNEDIKQKSIKYGIISVQYEELNFFQIMGP